jgi:two-component system response regulator
VTNTESASQIPIVLLAEDNDNEIVLMRESLKRASVSIDLRTVDDGEKCMAFLRKQGDYVDAPTPHLLLLDLNMPRMDGREVLAAIHADETLRHLPVVILTTSADEREVLKLYKLGCNSYILKPVDFNQFLRVTRLLADYWFTVAVLPHAPTTTLR